MTRLVCWSLALAAACTVGEDATHDHDSPGLLDLDSALLVRTRDHLAVCVQLDPALGSDPALASRLRDDLAAVRANHPDWHAAGLEHGAIEVAVGCPGGALADRPVDGKGAGGAVLGPGLTPAPSPFRTHVHLIADARAAAILGDALVARAIAELVPVDEHRVAEVSTALVARGSAVGTDAFRRALAASLGLREVTP